MLLADSAYVHIPFCSSICGYCDFPKVYYNASWADAYLRRLFSEIRNELPEGAKLKTIYVGGGTPTCLPDAAFSSLLSFLSAYLDEGGEFSVEANPESLTKEKARLMKRHGVNRVSLGIQSSSPRLLAILGRKHTFADAEKAIALLKEQGIANINADMMYALPTESEAELMADIQAFIALDIDHISAYSLILEDNTLFKAKGLSEASQDEQGKSYETILQAFRDAGYERYEVSNFARNGRRCRHNLTYWKNEKYYGFGLGAASYLGNERRKNTLNLTAYLAGKTIVERETVSEKDELEYFLLCNLRLAEGFEPDVFAQKFGLPFEEKCPTATELFQRGLLINEGNRVRASDYGLLTLDSILVKLFAD